MTLAAGQRLTAALLNNILGVLATDEQGTAGTTASVTFVTALTSGSTCGCSFVAPTSGKVSVLVHSRLRTDAATGIALISPRIGTGGTIGSGTVITAAADNNALQHAGTADEGSSMYLLQTGLTPGSTYNVVLQHRRAITGTATFTGRKVTVIPVPA